MHPLASITRAIERSRVAIVAAASRLNSPPDQSTWTYVARNVSDEGETQALHMLRKCGTTIAGGWPSLSLKDNSGFVGLPTTAGLTA